MALGADLLVRSVDGDREVAVEDFLYGPFMTVLEPNEMVVGVRFRPADAARRSVFDEFSTRHGDFAFAMTAVAGTFRDGVVRDVRIALGAVGPVPVRVRAAESALEGSDLSTADIAAAARLAMEGCDPAGDARASGEFRRELIEVLVDRALRRLREMS
jgi:CO/xanthine dehydrogenase FAD-binding subunit